jgi:glyoxylase-like metal-dependent hydrolase (beta-lactamase superfamily II)
MLLLILYEYLIMGCASSMITKNEGTVYPIIVPAAYGLKSYNFYLFKQGGSLSLIDAGIDSEECWDYFCQTLTEYDLGLEDITEIILTHNHHDHVGLVNRIWAKKEVPVYAHADSIYRLKRDKAFFTLRVEFFKQLYEENGCGAAGEKEVQKLRDSLDENEKNTIRADISPIDESDQVAGLQVIETPGHAPDHLVFFDAGRKWLFGGDHLISHISSNAILEPDRYGQRILTLVAYLDSLQACQKLDVETVFPGHGEWISEPQELIAKRLVKTDEKAEKLLRLIEEGHSTANEIALVFYKRQYPNEFSLVMSEIIGHLDYLETIHKVEKELKAGVWNYRSRRVSNLK